MVKSKSVTNPKAKINYLKVGMMDKNVSCAFYFKYFLGTTMIQNQKQNLKL